MPAATPRWPRWMCACSGLASRPAYESRYLIALPWLRMLARNVPWPLVESAGTSW